ncbi:MAG: hypothetical protein IJG65_07060 [Synergistaceae bacterium]|nr:hypothetical protein [Synergistaceae bacterium]
MKVDTRYGSIWDELPPGTERKIPETQEEARDFYEAAKSSMHSSLMKTWDKHNEMMRKSAELRRVSDRKKAIERQEQERREEQREFLEADALKRKGK